MIKIVVIGANGYIGKNLAYYIKENYVDIELKLYGRKPDSHTPYCCAVDMRDEDAVSKIDLKCDYIFMLAGKTGSLAAFQDPTSFLESNVKTLLLLLKEYVKQGSKAKLIFPSTRLLYQDAHMAKENEVTNEMKSIYAICKQSCEQYIELYHVVFGVQYIVFRICIPYGTMVNGASSYGTVDFMLRKARNRENIVLYGDGRQRRTLTHIEDLCRYMCEGAFNNNCANNTYNIGGENYSLTEMANLIAKRYKVNVDYIEWPREAYITESGDTVFDGSRLEMIVGKLYKNTFASWIAHL